MPNAELLWCEIPNVSRPSGQQLPILNPTHRSGYCHVFKLEKERLGWVYAKKVYFHRYKSQNIETLIARITENTQMLPGSSGGEMMQRNVQWELNSQTNKQPGPINRSTGLAKILYPK